ncbi:MAG: glycerol kinase GlpK [Planctomycetota bacterium]|nr:glycerol kinase GlpK [Planctomycetota bacterium]
MSHLIALDAGTTGVTAVLYDTDLRPQKWAYREFAQHFPRPGWVEHKAGEIRDAVDETLAELLLGFDGSILGVGITNQRETVFPCLRSSGEALANGIVWQDRRTQTRCDELAKQGHADWIQERTGLLLDPYFSGSKMQWLIENVPGVRTAVSERDLVFATVDTLIVQHLVGGEHWVTEPTNASRTMLFDLQDMRFDGELCALFDVPMECLATVKPSVGELGLARLPHGFRAPILGMAGDQQSALFGQGCWESGDSKVTYGTGCFLVLNTGMEPVRSAGGLLTTVALNRKGEPCFALEGSVFAGGLIIQWLRDGLGILESADRSESMAREVPDSGGVTLVPAFAGLGAPHWDPGARAALMGMTRGTGRSHIVRAALEAIALQCTDIVELFRSETGLALDRLRVDGGAALNGLLMQMQSDLAGAEVIRAADIESTARGAAALAGLGAGVWNRIQDASAFSDEGASFKPVGNEEAVQSLRMQWQDALGRTKTR